MKKLSFRTALACVFVCLLAVGSAWAQSSSGTVAGRVIDSSGAAIAGADVQLTEQTTQDTRKVSSAADGDFLFSNVQPGTFTVTIRAAGFKRLDKSDINLTASDRLAIGDLRLEVGTITETVEVKAEGAQVKTASSEHAGLLDSKQITDLMARGRDVMALLQLLPGAVDDNTGSDTLGQFSTPTMDGTRSFYNALNIDGISGNTARGRTAESPINMDAIAEVKVLANTYTAESGTAAGAVINIVTKSGTQQFHGGAYYYNRNEAFNANNFFNNRQGIARQRYRYNTEGSNLGGPIYIPGHFNTNKQKLFFFFSQEYLPNQQPNSIANFTVPTALERAGDFSQSFKSKGVFYAVKDPTTGARVPEQHYPRQPDRSELVEAAEHLPAAQRDQHRDHEFRLQLPDRRQRRHSGKEETLRVEYNRSEKARMWFKVSGYSSNNTGRTSAAISNQWGLADVDYPQTMPQLGTNFTYIFSPTLINEATLGMNLWTESQLLSDKGWPPISAPLTESNSAELSEGQSARPAAGDVVRRSHQPGAGHLRRPLPHGGRFDGFQLQRQRHQDLGQSTSSRRASTWSTLSTTSITRRAATVSPAASASATDTSNPLDSGYAYANAILGNYDTYSEATNRVDYAPITRICGMVCAGSLETHQPPVDGHWRALHLRPAAGAEQQQCREFCSVHVCRLAGAGAVPPGGGKRREGHDQPADGRRGAAGVLRADRAGFRKSD